MNDMSFSNMFKKIAYTFDGFKNVFEINFKVLIYFYVYITLIIMAGYFVDCI